VKAGAIATAAGAKAGVQKGVAGVKSAATSLNNKRKAAIASIKKNGARMNAAMRARLTAAKAAVEKSHKSNKKRMSAAKARFSGAVRRRLEAIKQYIAEKKKERAHKASVKKHKAASKQQEKAEKMLAKAAALKAAADKEVHAAKKQVDAHEMNEELLDDSKEALELESEDAVKGVETLGLGNDNSGVKLDAMREEAKTMFDNIDVVPGTPGALTEIEFKQFVEGTTTGKKAQPWKTALLTSEDGKTITWEQFFETYYSFYDANGDKAMDFTEFLECYMHRIKTVMAQTSAVRRAGKMMIDQERYQGQ